MAIQLETIASDELDHVTGGGALAQRIAHANKQGTDWGVIGGGAGFAAGGTIGVFAGGAMGAVGGAGIGASLGMMGGYVAGFGKGIYDTRTK